MKAHTPGPWEVVFLDGAPCAIRLIGERQTVECDCAECDRDDAKGLGRRTWNQFVTTDSHVYGPTRQDAILMAASPDLLTAARRALHEMSNTAAPRTSFTDAVDALDAAIAKAEGR